MTMAAGGVLGMLGAGPAAACGDRHYHGRVSLAERRRYAEAKRNFWATAKAFNDTKTIPIEQSALWQELDPNIAIYDFDSGNQLMASGREASIYYLYNLPTANFEPAPGTVCFHVHQNPQIVTGHAYWTGNDGAGTAKIFFTWELNNHLVASIKGQVAPPVA